MKRIKNLVLTVILGMAGAVYAAGGYVQHDGRCDGSCCCVCDPCDGHCDGSCCCVCDPCDGHCDGSCCGAAACPKK